MFGTLLIDVEAAILEFCGTFLFLFIAFGGVQATSYQQTLSLSHSGQTAGQVNPTPTIIGLLYSSTSFGLGLLISIWLFFRATGGLFNPNVTTALLLVGIVSPVRWALFCFAQLLGAIAASAVILALVPGPVAFNTHPGQGVNAAQAVFIEMFVTAALCLSVLMLATERHRSKPFAPIGIGLTLYACELFSTLYTGGSLNTARSFGPGVISGFYKTHWVYWVGPFLGSALAAGFFAILKHIRYWTLDPEQDSVNPARSPESPIDALRGTTTMNVARPAGQENRVGADRMV